MKYFAKIVAQYSTKNKAHAMIQEYARKHDATLLGSEQQKEKFYNNFKQYINAVNSIHKRCNDIHLSGYKYVENTIAVSGNFTMTIYEVKNEQND